MKHIVITGIDKSGKTSIANAYMEKTNYKNYMVDRDPSTYHFLNFVQDRIVDINQVDEYLEFIENFKHSIDLAVLLICNPSALKKRFRLNNEPKLVGDLSIEEHQEMLKEYFERVDYPNSIIIETSNKTIDECVNIIIKRLQE